MILTLTPNPCVDKTLFVDSLGLGSINRASKYTCIPGGKGINVSRALKTLGYETKAIVVVGGKTGEHVVDMIRDQDGVECVPVWVAGQTRTITTVLEEDHNRQTPLFEPGSFVTENEYAALKRTFENEINHAKVVTFNGTVSDPAIKELYCELIEIAKSKDVITILDSHGEEFVLGLESGPHMVKPNVVEAERALGQSLDSDAAKLDALDFFHGKGVETAAISLGAEGLIISRAGTRLRVTPPTIDEVNPVGSGDALVAGLAAGVLDGASLEEMAVLGVAAGCANAMMWDIGHFEKERVDELKSQVQIERL